MSDDEATPQTHLRVVRGTADDDELAALVAGLVAGAGAAGTGRRTHDAAAVGRRRWRAAVEPNGTWQPSADAWRWSARS